MPIWSLNFAIRAKKAAFYRNAINLTILILTEILLQTSNQGGILARYSALGVAFKAIWRLKPLCTVSTNKPPLKQ